MHELASSESEVFIVEQLKARFLILGIENVLWDFDDTLGKTKELYQQKTAEACGILLYGANWPGMTLASEEERAAAIKLREKVAFPVVRGMRQEMFVSPVINQYSLWLTAKTVGVKETDPRFQKAMEQIYQIHESPVEIYPGAKETIDLVNKTGVDSFLMTHASREWTQIKLVGAGLSGRFKSVGCFSIDRGKEEQWEKKLKEMKVDPKVSLIIGDNFQADIKPLLALGSWAVWVTKDELNNFPRVLKIPEIGEMVNGILTWEIKERGFRGN